MDPDLGLSCNPAFLGPLDDDLSPIAGPISVADLDGFRVHQTDLDDEGDTYVWVRWVLFDRQFDDVHVVGAVVGPEGIESFEAELNQLLKNVVWVAAE